MILEHLERRMLVERQVAAVVAVAVGGGELPDLDEARARVITTLTEQPEVIDQDRLDLLIALGLR